MPAPDGRDRRETGFYRTPDFVADYLARRVVAHRPGLEHVLDPCVGDGAFLRPFLGRGLRLAGMDVHGYPRPPGIRFRQEDFLRFYGRQRAEGREPLPYDAYVLNPPYNCHEVAYIREHKATLKRLFPDVGVYNLYALFLAATLDLARPGALIAALTLDSFLTARAHEPLRRRILQHAVVHELVLCPTDLFRDQGADVRTCLLLLEKRAHPRPADAPLPKTRVRVLDRSVSTDAFRRALAANRAQPTPLSRVVLHGPADRSELVVGVPPAVRRLFEGPRLRDGYRCITGISTGDDRRYLRPAPAAGHAVPFYKNPGRRRFWCAPDAYLPDDYEAIAERAPTFIVRNRRWLREQGLVCSSMGVPFAACHRPADTTFGVNANVLAPRGAWWLLAYLNSSLVTYLVRGILARSNMVTAGYVGRIPVPVFESAARRSFSQWARRAWKDRVSPQDAQERVAQIDARLYDELALPGATRRHVDRFAGELLTRT